MSDSPSDDLEQSADSVESPDEENGDGGEANPTAELAERVAGLIGADSWTADFGLAKLKVTADNWVSAVEAARDKAGLNYLSFLSAIDWSNEVTVGEPPAEEVEERYEVIVSLSSVRNSDTVVISTDIPKDGASLDTIVPQFGGAEWHERETTEMFGIVFVGNPNPVNLYLPDAFEGHPLRKSYRLLSREVKPWPGMVDVEDMPSTENTEADAVAAGEEAGDGGAVDEAAEGEGSE